MSGDGGFPDFYLLRSDVRAFGIGQYRLQRRRDKEELWKQIRIFAP